MMLGTLNSPSRLTTRMVDRSSADAGAPEVRRKRMSMAPLYKARASMILRAARLCQSPSHEMFEYSHRRVRWIPHAAERDEKGLLQRVLPGRRRVRHLVRKDDPRAAGLKLVNALCD